MGDNRPLNRQSARLTSKRKIMKIKGILRLISITVLILPATTFAIDPEAHAMPMGVTTAGGTLYTFPVTYTDDGAVEVSSFGNSNLRIIGPGGFNVFGAYVNVDDNTSGTPRIATYAFFPPGGSWDAADNGTYNIEMQPDEVFDIIGNPVAPGNIGSFTVTAPPGNPTPTPTPGTFANISTRLRVETGDNVLIGGFIITGTAPKRVIVRAIGPSLSSIFPDALADPTVELRDSSGGLIRSNDNWRSDQEAEITATGVAPVNDLESAIVETLPANGSLYTAIVRGANNGTGIGIVEAYDLDQTVDSRLANISTRGLVQTGDNVLIGGLIIQGQGPLKVIVRAIGPSLQIPGNLYNPTLELRDGNGALIAGNDNWRDDQGAAIVAILVPPAREVEAAIARDLVPGNYTAIVRGANNTTGIAVVEAYGVN